MLGFPCAARTRATRRAKSARAGTDVAPGPGSVSRCGFFFRGAADMAKTVGDFLVQRLSAWGVKRVFGYPGDGINGVFGALGRLKSGADGHIDFVQARHEEMAAFMACGHAKFTGEAGVCLATS